MGKLAVLAIREKLIQKIQALLKRLGASSGEICTEMFRLERVQLAGLAYYVKQLEDELKEKENDNEEVF